MALGEERTDQPPQLGSLGHQVEGEETDGEQLEQDVDHGGSEAGQIVGHVTQPPGQGTRVVVGPQIGQGIVDAKRVGQPLVGVGQVDGDVLAEVGHLLSQETAHLDAEAAHSDYQHHHGDRRAHSSAEAGPFETVDRGLEGERQEEGHQHHQDERPERLEEPSEVIERGDAAQQAQDRPSRPRRERSPLAAG